MQRLSIRAHTNDGKNVGMDIFLEIMTVSASRLTGRRKCRSALRQNYTVGLSGGTDKFQATFSAGYLKTMVSLLTQTINV